MEILIGIALAIAGMLWAFFRGKGSQKRSDLKNDVDEGREENEAAQGGVEEEIDAIDDRLDDNQARDMSSEEAIRILRERHGWDPIDDHAP